MLDAAGAPQPPSHGWSEAITAAIVAVSTWLVAHIRNARATRRSTSGHRVQQWSGPEASDILAEITRDEIPMPRHWTDHVDERAGAVVTSAMAAHEVEVRPLRDRLTRVEADAQSAGERGERLEARLERMDAKLDRLLEAKR